MDACQESDWSPTEAKSKKIWFLIFSNIKTDDNDDPIILDCVIWHLKYVIIIKIDQSSSNKTLWKFKSFQTLDRADTPDYISYKCYKTLQIIEI